MHLDICLRCWQVQLGKAYGLDRSSLKVRQAVYPQLFGPKLSTRLEDAHVCEPLGLTAAFHQAFRMELPYGPSNKE